MLVFCELTMTQDARKKTQAFRFLFVAFLLSNLIGMVTMVPASPADKLWDEISNVKSMMSSISDELERFNMLYLTKLEHRMISMATTLGNLDSNIKNLQERAHVWDTFQLHVSAWNDQIKTLDKKVDILNRGQEKVMNLEGKVNNLLGLEFKLERMAEKLDEADSKITALSKTMEEQKDSPLFHEFATRGALATLKVIERKVDRIGVMSSRNGNGNTHLRNGNVPSGTRNGNKPNGGAKTQKNESVQVDNDASRGKLVIRCNTPPVIEKVLNDMSSKVEEILDKVSKNELAVNYTLGLRDNLLQPENAEEGPQSLVSEGGPSELKEPADQLFTKLWKRLMSPFKKTTRALESVEEFIRTFQDINNNSVALWEDQLGLLESYRDYFDEISQCCHSTNKQFTSFSSNADFLLKKVEGFLLNFAYQDEQRLEVINQLFQKQNEHFTVSFSDLVSLVKKKLVCRNETTSVSVPRSGGETTTTNIPIEKFDDDAGDRDSDVSGDDDWEVTGTPDYGGAGHSCEGLKKDGVTVSSVYSVGLIGIDESESGFDYNIRYCDMKTEGGGWTVIQRRGDFGEPRQNFSLDWLQYKQGFGDLMKEFWFGNDHIHRLTKEQDMVLRIELEDFDGNRAFAEYSSFRLDDEQKNYALWVDGYSGNATDSLSAHNGFAFSTVDRDNDDAPPCCPCAPAYGGGWWFYSCFESNLNGVYHANPVENDYFRGIIWELWLGDYSLKASEMKIRPKTFPQDSNFDNQGSADEKPLDIPEDP